MKTFLIILCLAVSSIAEDTGTPVYIANVEMHVSRRFSQEETDRLAHFLITTLANKCTDLDLAVLTGSDVHCDLRIDVFLSKAWDPRNQASKAYAVFVQAANTAKLRKRLEAANLSEDQVNQWIDDKQYPVLVADYVHWTICPADELRGDLTACMDEIAKSVVPELKKTGPPTLKLRKATQ